VYRLLILYYLQQMVIITKKSRFHYDPILGLLTYSFYNNVDESKRVVKNEKNIFKKFK